MPLLLIAIGFGFIGAGSFQLLTKKKKESTQEGDPSFSPNKTESK